MSLLLMLRLAAVVCSAAGIDPGFDIPYLVSPTQAEQSELATASQNPWKWESKVNLFKTMETMYTQGEGVDLEAQKRYQKDIDGLKDTVSKEAAEIKAAQERQRRAELGIYGEADGLNSVHNTEMSQMALFNAGATVANKLYLSETTWQRSLRQSEKVGQYVATDDSDVVGVINGGDGVLKKAEAELDDLETTSLSQADHLWSGCHDPQMTWNHDATTTVNEQTHGLADIFNRTERLFTNFDRAHEKIVELITALSNEQKEVTGSETPAASLLQERAKAALEMPVMKLKGNSLDATGYFDKLAVLKDLFEAKFDESLTPMHLLVKKFHDA